MKLDHLRYGELSGHSVQLDLANDERGAHSAPRHGHDVLDRYRSREWFALHHDWLGTLRGKTLGGLLDRLRDGGGGLRLMGVDVWLVVSRKCVAWL